MLDLLDCNSQTVAYLHVHQAQNDSLLFRVRVMAGEVVKI